MPDRSTACSTPSASSASVFDAGPLGVLTDKATIAGQRHLHLRQRALVEVPGCTGSNGRRRRGPRITVTAISTRLC